MAPELLRTCKQIRSEALPVHYGNNDFYLKLQLQRKEIKAALKALEEVVLLGGPKPFRSLEIHLGGEIWQQLGEILPLLEFIRATRFEPATKQYRLPEVEKRTGVRNETGYVDRWLRLKDKDRVQASRVLAKLLSSGRSVWDVACRSLRGFETHADPSPFCS
jgi:hypothetical protein